MLVHDVCRESFVYLCAFFKLKLLIRCYNVDIQTSSPLTPSTPSAPFWPCSIGRDTTVTYTVTPPSDILQRMQRFTLMLCLMDFCLYIPEVLLNSPRRLRLLLSPADTNDRIYTQQHLTTCSFIYYHNDLMLNVKCFSVIQMKR